MEASGLGALPLDVVFVLLFKILKIFVKNPIKYKDLRKISPEWEYILNDESIKERLLPIFHDLKRKVMFKSPYRFRMYNEFYKALIPFAHKRYAMSIMPLNENNMFIVFDLLNALAETDQLFIFNNCGDNRQLTDDECFEIDIVMASFNTQNIFRNTDNFTTDFVVKLNNYCILNLEDVNYVMEGDFSLNSIQLLFRVIFKKEVYKVFKFIEYLIIEYPWMKPAIYTICNKLQICKLEDEVAKVKLHNEELKEKLTKFCGRYCETIIKLRRIRDNKTFDDSTLYCSMIFQAHLQPNYKCNDYF